jgi:hypothetical protein
MDPAGGKMILIKSPGVTVRGLCSVIYFQSEEAQLVVLVEGGVTRVGSFPQAHGRCLVFAVGNGTDHA